MGGYGAFLAALRRPDLTVKQPASSGLLQPKFFTVPKQDGYPVFMKELSMILVAWKRCPQRL